MPRFQIFDRSRGGLVTVDSSVVTVSTYLKLNLNGTVTPTTDANDPLVLTFDATRGFCVPARQVGAGAGSSVTATRSRNAGTITWEAAGSATTAELASGKYGAVSDGAGGYIITGRNFRSDTPGTCAFKVMGTAMVTFRNCNFFGYGTASTAGRGIIYGEYHNAVEFEECIWFSGKPPAGFAGAFPGKLVNMDTPSHVSFKNCEAYKCGGIYIRHWWNQSGSGRTDTNPLYAARTVMYDLDARMVDSAGNWRTGTAAGTDFDPASFVSLQNASLMDGGLLEDIRVLNDPLYGGQWEDVVSWFSSSPAAGKELRTRRFLFEGGYVYDQTFTGVEAVHGAPGGTRKFYSGTGGNMGDGLEAMDDSQPPVPILPRSANTVPHNLVFQDGTVIGGGNMGISINGGNRNGFINVKAISSGAFRSSNPRGYTTVATPSYAFQVWDLGGNYAGSNPYTAGDPTYWYGHYDTDCTFGWWNINPSTGAISVPSSSPGGPMTYIPTTASKAGLTTTNRTILATPATVLDALALEDTYRAAQLAVWSGSGTVIGCTLPAA